MNDARMVFAGFGGQGVLFMGKVAAYAGMIAGREVSWMPSYGPEMRGGTANCSVCISDKPIGSPLVTRPPALVVLNGPSFDKFIDAVAPGGHVFTDSSLVDRTCTRTDITVHAIPATQLSNEQGLEGIANMIVFGKLLGVTEFASMADIEAAIKKSVPAKNAHLIEHNLRAIKLGMGL